MRFTRGFALVPITAAILVAVPSSAMAYGYVEKPSVSWNYGYSFSDTLVNTAKVYNGTNGTVKQDISLDFRVAFNPNVRVINDVVASSQCVGCASIALGFQVALVVHPAPKVYAENRSIAYNDRCVTCVTVALAYQFVVISPTPLELSDKTEDKLDQVAAELERLKASNLSAPEIDRKAAEQAEAVRAALAGDAAATGNPATIEVKRLADLDPR